MNNSITHRGYSIESEHSIGGTWAVYYFGYLRSFETIAAAKKYIDGRYTTS